jgi:hypothetical protein
MNIDPGNVMSNTRNLAQIQNQHRDGAVPVVVAVAPALAQSVAGVVAGHADAAAQVIVIDTAKGASRSVTVGKDGSYRIGQLPPGFYPLTSGTGAPVSLSVSLGRTTTVNLTGDGTVDLETVQVRGDRVVNRVDVHSTESATNITREELKRLPVDQNLASGGLLAPGVISSGSSFGGLSFDGSSVAENVVCINGLDVTDPYRAKAIRQSRSPSSKSSRSRPAAIRRSAAAAPVASSMR